MEPFPFLSVLESPTIVLPLSECQKGTATLRGGGFLLSLVEFKNASQMTFMCQVLAKD